MVTVEHKQISAIVKVVAGIMLLLALGSWGYSYYQILRVVVCASSIYLAWHMFELKQSGWGWGFVASAALFNPVFPVYLDRSVWQIIDVAVAVFFFASFSAEKTESK